MLKLYIICVIWGITLWYFIDSYNEAKSLGRAVIDMIHLLKIGVCENRQTIKEIIDGEDIFEENGAGDFSLFLWENHDQLGISADLIDSYNSFTKESEFCDGQVCVEGITAIEDSIRSAILDNQVELKGKLVSFVTVCTAVFSVVFLLMV